MAKVTVGSVPPEALSGGSLNQAPPMEQRSPEGAPESNGPIIGDNGEYKRATYRISRDLDGKKHTSIRQDR